MCFECVPGYQSADELFGGYAYLKALDQYQLPNELVDITRRLSNIAVQRVDRSASSHGLVAHVAFVDHSRQNNAVHATSRMIYQK